MLTKVHYERAIRAFKAQNNLLAGAFFDQEACRKEIEINERCIADFQKEINRMNSHAI